MEPVVTPVKKSTLPKILLYIGLGLVLLGILQAVFIGGLNFFIFPGAALMLVAALMPSKKMPKVISSGAQSTPQQKRVEGEVVEDKK